MNIQGLIMSKVYNLILLAEQLRKEGLEDQAQLFEEHALELQEKYDLPDIIPMVKEFIALTIDLGEEHVVDPDFVATIEKSLEKQITTARNSFNIKKVVKELVSLSASSKKTKRLASQLSELVDENVPIVDIAVPHKYK